MEKVSEVFNTLLKIDEKLKDTITEYQTHKISEEDFIHKLKHIVFELDNTIIDLKNANIFIREPTLLYAQLSEAVRGLNDIAWIYHLKSSQREADKEHLLKIVKNMNEIYRKYREAVSDHLDVSKYPQNCAVVYSEKTPIMLLNDITQCLHLTTMLAMESSSIEDTEKIQHGLCTVYVPKEKKHLIEVIENVLEDPNEYFKLDKDVQKDPLIKGTFVCSAWNQAAEWIYGLYYDEPEYFELLYAPERDLTALAGYVTEEKTYLRVGSQLGHYTVYNPKTDEIVYYDPDNRVRSLFMSLMRGDGLSCEDKDLGNALSHVKCKVDIDEVYPNSDGIYNLGFYLASVTGMDVRLDRDETLPTLTINYAHRVKEGENIDEDRIYYIMSEIESTFTEGNPSKKMELNCIVTKKLFYK